MLRGESNDGFGEISLSLASPDKVRSWSYGEVRLPETINYRTFKPEPGGLFCAKIFGPVKDYECVCGKYKGIKHHRVICEKCGVEVTHERVRRERMGHINLACPVAHILFFKAVPSRIGLMLDLTMRDIERILYFEAYVILDPKRLDSQSVGEVLYGKSGKEAGDYVFDRGVLLNTEQHQKVVEKFGVTSFEAGIGAEGLRQFLKSIDLDMEVACLREELQRANSETKRKKVFKRLKLMENFRRANLRPEWMILETLPVLPPNLRPLVQLEGGRFTNSDLNDLYRRVINRNNRLRKLMELDAPAIIVNNEKRMLQEAVDSLIDNGRRGKPSVAPNKRPLKSLADIVKGKTGRFRQNLLGKRVDFSARSVIVVGPTLQLHQCGLPKQMALNLFRPFIFNTLIAKGYAGNIKQARQKIDDPDGDVWDTLESVIRQHPILLNRAPTLHRLGIQAFEPVLIEGKAIQLHPLVCVAFNADFDGDQMAVHVPLSLEAQAEARLLMLSSNNILAPANGEPIILPSQDIVLGLYYATRERANAVGEGAYFSDLWEVEMALATGAVELQSRIRLLIAAEYADDADALSAAEKETGKMLVNTTVGRALMLRFYPSKMPFSLINRTLKKKDLSNLVSEIFHHCGLHDTVAFSDNLMRFGFQQSTRAGISICMQDMVIPDRKAEIIRSAEEEMRVAQKQFQNGLLTQDERYNKSIDLWDKAGEEISRVMMEELSHEPVLDLKTQEPIKENGKVRMQDSFNSLYVMADSGARGSQTQIKQLAGMRGLMTRPDGRIMESAITANFREGLSVLQYFQSTHGARKGLADTALKTANSGYLTRRLVDVAQDVVINAEDCGTTEGITLRAVLMGGEEVASLSERVLGRVLATAITDPQSEEVLHPAGTLMGEAEVQHIVNRGVEEVVVRSPVKCNLPHGLCRMCYGRDLARGRMVQLGEAVGVIAAQSIGEPGTQLTMRTFHIGGAASRTVMARSVEAKNDGVLRISARYLENSQGHLIVVSRGGEMSVHDVRGRERERYRLSYGEIIQVPDGGKVKAGMRISVRDPLTNPIIAEHAGHIHLEGVEEGVNARQQMDEGTGMMSWVITEDKRAGKKKNAVHIKFRTASGKPVLIQGTENEVSIALRPGTTLLTREGAKVSVGDIIATTPQEAGRSRDITGGLPRVAELFEAREPKESRLLAAASGRVSLRGLLRGKQILTIVDAQSKEYEHIIPKGRNLLVQDGITIKKGEQIVEGDANPHEILAIQGVEALNSHIVNEVQAVYRLQGVNINDKHIEVIVHQMLRCVRITDVGDSHYIGGEQVVYSEISKRNEELKMTGKAPIKYVKVLLGITKASLATDSFISAASFQETTRVLTDAAVSGQRDSLRGLKENVIVGRLVPAGTGFIHYSRAQRSDLHSEEAEEIMRSELTDGDADPYSPIPPDDISDASSA